MKFIFIDGSYFVFFRFNALKSWWKLAHQDEDEGENIELVPHENEEFKNKFRKTFADKLKEIPKKLGIKKNEPYRIYVGQDCKQETIWRMKHMNAYKGTRPNTSIEGKFFEIVYSEKLFENSLGDNCILKYPKLEADDVIALSVKHIIENDASGSNECYIVSSDGDYLQLCHERINIYDLKFKNLKMRNPAYFESESVKKMFVAKCLCGDKSDNIPSVFPKCGKKTAEKLAELDNESMINEIRKKLKNENEINAAIKQFELNDLMMNFDKIPSEYSIPFLQLNMNKFIC